MKSLSLPCSNGVVASLTFYGAGGQPRHAHGFTQLSFLLAGEMVERHGRREYELSGSAKGLKPAGEPHENCWGKDGALIFSARLRDPEMEAAALDHGAGWGRVARDASVPSLVRTLIGIASPPARSEVLWDLVAAASRPSEGRGARPRWLERAREAIRDAPESLGLKEAADSAGVHRVHFSQLFHRAYGMPPSLFRQRVMVGRAVRAILETPTPLSAVALDSGFSDQAHMTRCVKAASGLTPAALRRALA